MDLKEPSDSERIQDETSAQFSRLDTSKLTWTEVGFDFLLELDRPDKEQAQRNRTVDQVRVALHAISGVMGSSMVAQANALGRMAAVDGKSKAVLFPWLPGADRSVKYDPIDALDSYGIFFDIDKPLVGQSSTEVNLTLGRLMVTPRSADGSEVFNYGDAKYGVPIGFIYVDSISFEAGSFRSWIRGRIAILTLAVAFLGAIEGPIVKAGEAEMKVIQFYQQVDKALAGQSEVKFHHFEYSWAELDTKGTRPFNFAEKGIGPDERGYRISYVQLALKIYFKTDIVIDGLMGPETQKHLARFAEEHHCTPNINDQFLRAALRAVLTPP